MRRAGLAAAALALVLCAPVAASAAAPAVTREGVDGLLAEVRATGAAVSAAQGRALARRIGGDAPDVPLDPSVAGPVTRRLGDVDASVRARAVRDLEAHLVSMRAALGDPEVRTVEPNDAVLAEMLQRQVVDTRSDLTERVREWFDRALDAIVRWWSGAGGRGGAGRSVALVVGVAVLAVVLGFVAWRTVASVRARTAGRDAAAAVAAGEAVVAAAEGLPADALGFAESLAGEGRAREAVRALFGGAARALVDGGVVAQTRTRTDAELLAEAASAAPSVGPPLAELTEAFEIAWYGHVDPGARGYAGARGAYARVLDAAAEEAAG